MKKLLALAFLLAPSLACAQSTASLDVGSSATVLSIITLTGTQILDFGRVGQGVAKPIGPDSATSGRFVLAGNGAAQVGITFTLPVNLMQGAIPLPLDSWNATFNNSSDIVGGTAFVPVTGTEFTRTLPGSVTDFGQTQFYRIGATVRPALSQAPGTYTANIVVIARYLEI